MARVTIRLALACMVVPWFGPAMAVPPGFVAAIRLALDWPAHVLFAYIEGPWSPELLIARLVIDVPLQYALLALLGIDNAGPRAVASQVLAAAVHWFAMRDLMSKTS